MPYKDPEKKRAYQREYMRRRRAGVNLPDRPKPKTVSPGQGEIGPPQFIDRSRPFTVERRFHWANLLVQDGYWYEPRTGKLLGPARWKE